MNPEVGLVTPCEARAAFSNRVRDPQGLRVLPQVYEPMFA